MSEVSIAKVLKSSWFFIACAILSIYESFSGEYLQSIQIMIGYFFFEVGAIICLAKAGALKISGKIDVDDK